MMNTIKLLGLVVALIPSIALSQQFGPGEEEVGNEEKPKKDSLRCGQDRSTISCNDELEFDKNTQKVYHVKSGKPYTGKCESCHGNGKIEYQAKFIDGKEDGVSWSYYSDGSKHNMRTHAYGVEEGDWMYWYKPSEGGKLAWHFTYSQGKKHGKCIWYYKTGEEKKVEHYSQDLLDGVAIKYWAPNKIKSEINFKMGDYHGAYETFFESGTPSIVANYNRGELDGLAKQYYENEQILHEGEWNNGQKTGEWKHYYEDGSPKLIENYDNGTLHGKVYEYFEDEGKLKREADYNKGYLISEYLFDKFGNYIDENGKKISKDEAIERNKIIAATAESRMNQKGKKKGGFDFSTIDGELMCDCIKAEQAGEEETEDCAAEKKKYREGMAQANRRTQRKMRKMISECYEK